MKLAQVYARSVLNILVQLRVPRFLSTLDNLLNDNQFSLFRESLCLPTVSMEDISLYLRKDFPVIVSRG